MDTRRLLTIGAAASLISACASLSLGEDGAASSALAEPDLPQIAEAEVETAVVVTASGTERPYLNESPALSEAPRTVAMESEAAVPARTGRAAIAAANLEARAASRSDQFVGGVQVFGWAPGRVYEVWTAPLRVTTLSLAPGETVTSKAAGDTVRWQIGDTTSGAGATARTHILLKPLERGLETNLVLTTSHRVYLLELKSGSAEAFNAAVAWDAPEEPGGAAGTAETRGRAVDTTLVEPQGQLDARYAITPQGRAPRWMPTAVFNDGIRTFITFAPDVWTDEAPTLFVLAADGQAQLVNYRQQGGLFVVDRVFDRAELRLGGVRPRTVRLERLSGARR